MNKWLKFCLLYIGGTLIGMSQLKITPVIKPLAKQLQVSLTQMSLLTSIFTISGIFIAIPGGVFLTKLGAKKLLLIIMFLLALGNFGGIVARSFSLLLVTRIIEGISFSTIVMTSVVLITYWFKDSPRVGTAIGLFTTFPATASLIVMNTFLPLSQKFGQMASWYLIGSLALVLFVIYSFSLDGPSEAEIEIHSKLKKSLFARAASNQKMWILGVLQGCMAFVLYAYIALYPVLFSDYYRLSQGTANFYAGLFGLFGIPFGVVAGYLIDKTKKPGLVILLAFLMMFGACLAAPFLAGGPVAIILQVFVLSVAAMLASSAITIMVPKTAEDDSLIGYSMSFVNLFYYTAIVIGGPIVFKIIEQFTWFTGLMILTGVALLGVLVSLFYIKANKKSSTILGRNKHDKSI